MKFKKIISSSNPKDPKSEFYRDIGSLFWPSILNLSQSYPQIPSLPSSIRCCIIRPQRKVFTSLLRLDRSNSRNGGGVTRRTSLQWNVGTNGASSTPTSTTLLFNRETPTAEAKSWEVPHEPTHRPFICGDCCLIHCDFALSRGHQFFEFALSSGSENGGWIRLLQVSFKRWQLIMHNIVRNSKYVTTWKANELDI